MVQQEASQLKRKTNLFLLLGLVSCSLVKEFGSARKELKSVGKEFGLAKLLSWLATKEFCRLQLLFCSAELLCCQAKLLS